MIIITGATATGKSSLAVKLAKILNGEIISADSMQIYKKMDIGTAKISQIDMEGVPHHMLDIQDFDQPFSVTDFRDLAEGHMLDIVKRNKVPIIVGGTGFYINSLMYEQDFGVIKDSDLRIELENFLEINGNIALHSKLQIIDPISAEKIHYNNVRRVIRALEVSLISGTPFSTQNISICKKANNAKMYILEYNSRDELYNNINNRVDLMINNGLKEEVSNLLRLGATFQMQSMQGIGYKEWSDGNGGVIEDILHVSELIKLNSRHYAKRQITWYKRYLDSTFLSVNDSANLDKIALEYSSLSQKI